MRDERLGNYRLVSRIGEGGMGTVYRAEHTLLGREVAVKLLRPELSQHEDMVDRLFNEARATAQLRHPGIVDVFDVGRSASGAAFLVMELLDGESLTSRLARDGRLAWQPACRFARQISSSLAAAHRAQIVHRDLKPDNVFLVREPDQAEERTKVLDFGIAKLADAGARGASRTRADLILGTPAYMSPQQCRGAGQVDHRADIYALGCMLFEMVCGRPPFLGDGLGDLLTAHMMLLPPAPRGLVPELPEALEQLILRMLAKAEADRPQSMDEVAAELDTIAAAATGAGEGAAPPPARPSDAIGTASRAAAITTCGGSAGQVTPAAPAPPLRRRLVYAFGLAASLGMAATVAGALAFRTHLTQAPAHAAATAPLPQPAEHAVVVASPPPPPAERAAVEVSPPPPPPAEHAAVEAPSPPPAEHAAVEAPPPPPADPVDRDREPVIHEIACDPECDVVLDGDVVGKATPSISYRAVFHGRKGQLRAYLLLPTDHQHRAAAYRAAADRSVKALVRLPCASRDHVDASARPHMYDPYDSCNTR